MPFCFSFYQVKVFCLSFLNPSIKINFCFTQQKWTTENRRQNETKKFCTAFGCWEIEKAAWNQLILIGHQSFIHHRCRPSIDWIGLNWIGLNWIELDWNEMNWIESSKRKISCCQHMRSMMMMTMINFNVAEIIFSFVDPFSVYHFDSIPFIDHHCELA